MSHRLVFAVAFLGLAWGTLASATAVAQTAPPPSSPPPPLPPVASAAPSAVPSPPPPEKRLGVGFKIGNGLGFVGGDLIVAPIDHLAFDLQASWLSDKLDTGTATGYGFAPGVQGRLFAGQVSTPYVALGLLYAHLALNGVTASATGFFMNIGYEWRWDFGLGILLGAGVGHLGTVHATDGVTSLDSPGGTHFNLEAGVRYSFL
jgi:hypothetical protein